MALIHYPSLSGTEGTLRINGVDYPADSMQFQTHQTAVEFKTSGSMPFGDVSAGSRFATLKASGYCKTFNPFLQTSPPYLGTYAVIVCVFKAGNHVAGFPSALIIDWTYNNKSDGVPTWSLEALGDYKFTNMGNTFL